MHYAHEMEHCYQTGWRTFCRYFWQFRCARAQAPDGNSVATLAATADGIVWQPQVNNDGFTLTISGPNGFYQTTDFTAEQTPGFLLRDNDGNSRAEGGYHYELVVHPLLDSQIRNLMENV